MTKTVTGTIHSAYSLNNSVNGNPRFKVIIETPEGQLETYLTSSDASVNYDIRNLEHSHELAVFTLTKADRITYAERI